jgi:hypothetical protein
MIGKIPEPEMKRNFSTLGGVLLLCVALFFPQTTLAMPSLQTTPLGSDVSLPILTPDSTTAATLHTHRATITTENDAQGASRLRLDATYDFRNETREAIQLPLRVTNGAGVDLTLTQSGAPILLTPSDDGDLIGQISIPANDRADVVLSSSYPFADLALVQVVYPTELLRQWRGQRSIRVELASDSTGGRDSWLRIEPDTWTYAPFSDDLRLEWMFEGEIPPRIVYQTVAPAIAQELQRLTGAAVGNAPEIYTALGEIYRRLAMAAAQIGVPSAQDRFLGQAVAALTEGLRQAEVAGAAVTEIAELHASLAELYRDQIAGAENTVYAQAMVAEAGLALRGIMVDDPRRAELEQWQVDGLRLMLADLRRRGDIPGALALIEQLRTLPASASGSDFLEQERQALIVQQAVQLVEFGDRDTALTLAGDLINDLALQPPSEYRNLFTRWDVSTAMSDRGVEVRAVAQTGEGRAEEAQAALDRIVQSWRTSQPLRAMDPQVRRISAEGAPEQFEVSLHIPAGNSGVELANALPLSADWAMLRQLLAQLGPQIRTQYNNLLWQQVQVTQPLDLRTVGEQWRRVATELERQAEAFEQEATLTTSAATMQASQEARLRAANYRYTAQAWRELAQNSQVVVSLSTPGSVNNNERAWIVTAASPPQMLNVEVEAISSARLLVAALAALSALFGLAALLWRLL